MEGKNMSRKLQDGDVLRAMTTTWSGRFTEGQLYTVRMFLPSEQLYVITDRGDEFWASDKFIGPGGLFNRVVRTQGAKTGRWTSCPPKKEIFLKDGDTLRLKSTIYSQMFTRGELYTVREAIDGDLFVLSDLRRPYYLETSLPRNVIFELVAPSWRVKDCTFTYTPDYSLPPQNWGNWAGAHQAAFYNSLLDDARRARPGFVWYTPGRQRGRSMFNRWISQYIAEKEKNTMTKQRKAGDTLVALESSAGLRKGQLYVIREDDNGLYVDGGIFSDSRYEVSERDPSVNFRLWSPEEDKPLPEPKPEPLTVNRLFSRASPQVRVTVPVNASFRGRAIHCVWKVALNGSYTGLGIRDSDGDMYVFPADRNQEIYGFELVEDGA